MPSVLIVDDDSDICFLERMVLRSADGRFTVVGEAASGDDAIRCWRELRPNIIVLDDHLPDMRGLDVARLILGEEPGQVIVLVTADYDDAAASAASLLGVRAYLPKTELRRLLAQVLGYPR